MMIWPLVLAGELADMFCWAREKPDSDSVGRGFGDGAVPGRHRGLHRGGGGGARGAAQGLAGWLAE